ncbi:MAG: hypothetical protein RLY67_503 [Pseudomonadota bacterium]
MAEITGFWVHPNRYRALLFDVDGTLAETEGEGHLPSFNEAFRQLGIDWDWSCADYGRLLRVAGGLERMHHHALSIGQGGWAKSAEGQQLLAQAHRLKNDLYAKSLAAGVIKPRPGVVQLIKSALAEGMEWAVVTTTSTSNWNALWEGCLSPELDRPPAIAICGEDVSRKKPDPEAYQLAVERLRLSVGECLAVEDSPNGLEAARSAGLDCVVVRSLFFAEALFNGALADLKEPHELRIGVPGEFQQTACRQ